MHPRAHKETAVGACASWRTARGRAVGKTPFPASPSMRNLAPGVRGGKHERSRRRDPDSEEPQTAGHRSPVRGRRVSGHPDCRSGAEGRRCLYRHAQRAGRLLRGAGLRLSDRPPRRLHRCDRPRRGARSRRPRQCPAKLLANDPVWGRLGDLSRRHGRIPYYVEMATRNAINGRPGATYLDVPDDIITGKCDVDKVVQVERAPDPPRMVAPMENIEAALNLLQRAERPLVLIGKGMAWSRAENEVRAFIERTQLPFLRSPMGKGVMADDHPLSVAAARTLALQNAGVVFLMGAGFNWIFHFGQPPRYAKDVKVIQLDISAEEIGHNKATEVALVGDGKAIVGQLNQSLAGRQWFYPKDTPWRQMIAKKADENAAQIRPQIQDDEAPANYFRALRDVAAWLPRNAILSAEGAGTMDIGLTQLPSFSARSCLNAGTYGTMGVGLGHAIAACVVHPDRPVIHLSGDSAIGFSGMEMETLVRYDFPVKIVVLNNGGIGPGVPEIPENPMFNMKPNALIYGARYDRVMEAFGGKGFFVEDPKDLPGALDEAMNFPGPALVNVVISQGSARKPQQFRWHS